MTDQPSDELKLFKLGEHTSYDSETELIVVLTPNVKSDYSWSLRECSTDVTFSHWPALSHFTSLKTSENVNEMLSYLDKLLICPGHPDRHFMKMAKERKNFQHSKDGTTSDNTILACC